MVKLAGIILILSVLADVTLKLLLESHMQIIKLAGIILTLSIEVQVGVILKYLFDDTLA